MKKYQVILAPLLKKPFFTLEDAAKEGVSRQTLTYLEKKGILEKLSRGLYRSIHYEPQIDFEWEHLGWVAASLPKGVICLISALCYYQLTDQIMREAWIAIPHKNRAPIRPNTRIVRMRNTELGKKTISMGEYTVQIFDRERCIVDAFRYLSIEIALKALQAYFSDPKHRAQPQKLFEYATVLRVNIKPYILAYTT